MQNMFSYVRTYDQERYLICRPSTFQPTIYSYSHSHTLPFIHPLTHTSIHPSIQQLMTLYTDCAEKGEITDRCTDDHSRELRMPVELLDSILSLVDEEQLSRDPPNVLSPIGLCCVNVPQCKFVVLARGR